MIGKIWTQFAEGSLPAEKLGGLVFVKILKQDGEHGQGIWKEEASFVKSIALVGYLLHVLVFYCGFEDHSIDADFEIYLSPNQTSLHMLQIYLFCCLFNISNWRFNKYFKFNLLLQITWSVPLKEAPSPQLCPYHMKYFSLPFIILHLFSNFKMYCVYLQMYIQCNELVSPTFSLLNSMLTLCLTWFDISSFQLI